MSFVINSTGSRRRAAQPSSAAITLQRPRASAGGSRVRGAGVRGAGMQGATPLPYVNPAANRSTARSTFGRTVPPRRDIRAHSQPCEAGSPDEHLCSSTRGVGATPLPYVNPAANRSTARSTFGRTVPPRRDFRAQGQSGYAQCRGRAGHQHRPTSTTERARAPPNEHEHEHADVAAPVCAHARELSREAAPAPR